MNAFLRVVSIAPGASVQDQGRHGYQRFGIAEGGVMDRTAYAEGAALVGNAIDSAVIEFFGNGGEFQVCGQPILIACTGASMGLKVDGNTVPWRTSVLVNPGQVIVIAAACDAVFGYLHVQGGIDVPVVLGSRSTHIRAGFGGYGGRFLQAGDELPIIEGGAGEPYLHINNDSLPAIESVRIVWGPQADQFSEEVRTRFVDARFTMSTARDRMGARLQSECSFISNTSLSGISDAVLAGDIQIGGDGQATVLLADRQPTGGYPRIATIISADLDRFVQLPALAEFRFCVVRLADAVVALDVYRKAHLQMKDSLRSLHRAANDIPDLLAYNLIDGVVNALEAEQ